MINRSQAEVIAEAVLSAARDQSLERRNGEAKRVPWYLRSREMMSLQPYQRAEIVRGAELIVQRSVAFYAVVAFFALLAFGAWYNLPENSAFVLVPVSIVVGAFVRGVFVWLRVRSLLRGARSA